MGNQQPGGGLNPFGNDPRMRKKDDKKKEEGKPCLKQHIYDLCRKKKGGGSSSKSRQKEEKKRSRSSDQATDRYDYVTFDAHLLVFE